MANSHPNLEWGIGSVFVQIGGAPTYILGSSRFEPFIYDSGEAIIKRMRLVGIAELDERSVAVWLAWLVYKYYCDI